MSNPHCANQFSFSSNDSMEERLDERGTVLTLDAQKVFTLRESFKNTLIGKFLGKRFIPVVILQSIINNLWQTHGYIWVERKGDFYIFYFHSTADKDFFLTESIVTFHGLSMILKERAPNQALSEVDFSYMDIWVQFPNAPLEAFYFEAAESMGCLEGDVLQVDWSYPVVKGLHGLRVKVRTRTDQALVPGVYVHPPAEPVKWVYFSYERVFKVCYRCGVAGHTNKNCPSNLVEVLEILEKEEFDYTEGEPIGPSNWGNFNIACRNGTMQSPIDISILRVNVVGTTSSSSQLTTNYKPSNATLKNRRHDIALQWDDGQAGSIQINGTDYFLQQAHWHYPTEHAIDGLRYDMELHLVHKSLANETIAVVGILYRFGLPDPFLSKLAGDIWALSNQNQTERKVGVIDPREVGLYWANYYRYMGSLTTPNCSEGVIWTIKQRVMTVSRQQVTLLREAVHDPMDNARPLQQLNNRDITLYLSFF